jgi:hypothetical protein
MRDKDRPASFQLPKSYSVKKNVGGVPQQTRRLSRLNIAQWRCGDQLGETVKSRVSHQPPGFRMGKEYPGILSPDQRRTREWVLGSASLISSASYPYKGEHHI